MVILSKLKFGMIVSYIIYSGHRTPNLLITVPSGFIQTPNTIRNRVVLYGISGIVAEVLKLFTQ